MLEHLPKPTQEWLLKFHPAFAGLSATGGWVGMQAFDDVEVFFV